MQELWNHGRRKWEDSCLVCFLALVLAGLWAGIIGLFGLGVLFSLHWLSQRLWLMCGLPSWFSPSDYPPNLCLGSVLASRNDLLKLPGLKLVCMCVCVCVCVCIHLPACVLQDDTPPLLGAPPSHWGWWKQQSGGVPWKGQAGSATQVWRNREWAGHSGKEKIHYWKKESDWL